jgi:hypothetical protein
MVKHYKKCGIKLIQHIGLSGNNSGFNLEVPSLSLNQAPTLLTEVSNGSADSHEANAGIVLHIRLSHPFQFIIH